MSVTVVTKLTSSTGRYSDVSEHDFEKSFTCYMCTLKRFGTLKSTIRKQ